MVPQEKLAACALRLEELEQLLCDVGQDARRMLELTRERARLAPIVDAWARYGALSRQLADTEALLSDSELGEVAAAELPELRASLAELEQELELLLLPADPNDERNTILEIRAGTGGEEAALFAADLLRMYLRYAERRRWTVELLSQSEAAGGGLKEVIASVRGERVWSQLRWEAGVHRVQRVPTTESQGRIHTSTATVAVLPEADEVDVVLDDADLRFDIAAASGPGGQGVNTTNSAVQVTHLPSGMSVRCMEERSQLKNKARALQILRSRLLDRELAQAAEATRDARRAMVGGGDRSEKIRTYNFPQNRLTDHRIGLTLYKLDRVVEGELDELVGALVSFHQAARLEAARGGGP